jgi:hypothetical protein
MMFGNSAKRAVTTRRVVCSRRGVGRPFQLAARAETQEIGALGLDLEWTSLEG